MYSVDEKDRVITLADWPQPSFGAPCPVVLSDELRTVVAFYLQNTPADWDGRAVRIISPQSDGEPVVLALFSLCYARMFGPPSDDSFVNHPLSNRGLKPHSASMVENSSWARRLARINSFYKPVNHFVLSFHDSTFECLADRYTVEFHERSIESLLPRMMELLNSRP